MGEQAKPNVAVAFRQPTQSDSAARARAFPNDRFLAISAFGYAPKKTRLEGRQLEVAQLVALGLADKEIAHHLAVSQGTVKAYVSLILQGLGLYRRTQICRFVHEAGLFPLD